jgi:hypothetical protein
VKRLEGSGTVPEVSTSEYRQRRSRWTAVCEAAAAGAEEEVEEGGQGAEEPGEGKEGREVSGTEA